MSEAEFQIVGSIGFVLAFGAAVGIQRSRTHRVLAGSWRSNTGLWAVGAVMLGIVRAGCACTASRSASASGIGLFNTGRVFRESP